MALGTHNSYHQQPSSTTVDEWNYSHPPLPEQFDAGVRQIELDIQRNPETNAYQVLHVPVLDPETSCFLLADCLQDIADWSSAHPWHFPIHVLLEPKSDIASWGFENDADAWNDIDALISSIVGDMVYTPHDQRGNYASIRESVLSDGWPTLDRIRGKVIFVLLDTGEARETYLSNHTALDFPTSKMIFPVVAADNDFAGYFLQDDPDANIQQLAEQGFLIRTRGDAGLVEDAQRLDTALNSGAHAISTDLPSSRFWMDATHPVVCNPVTSGDVENCGSELFE